MRNVWDLSLKWQWIDCTHPSMIKGGRLVYGHDIKVDESVELSDTGLVIQYDISTILNDWWSD